MPHQSHSPRHHDADDARGAQSLLSLLARRPPQMGEVRLRYDSVRQVTQVWEHDRWVDSWDAAKLQGTKKMDVETGEDAKGQ
jgi:hypothetical protein